MRKVYIKITTAAILLISLFTACSLEETNPSTVDLEVAYTSPEGFESLVNYCYDGLYYFYGKIDGIGAMEMGTDLWVSESKESGFTLYDSKMNTELGTLRVIWNGFYATVNYCNTAIYYADLVEDYSEEEKNAKVAEAYFLRAWSYMHLVEQFGDVVLRTEPSSIAGIDNYPTRSSEPEFYDLIISDLKFACQHLPVNQGAERGRVAKKAAYGMLAKAYLQRTRLGEANASEYAKLALETAKELIDNQAAYNCALYTSDDTKSGYSKLWDGLNNKNNSEFLFLEAVDHEGFLNPDKDNRGRTRQYYLMDLKTVGAEWGTAEKNCAWYSRANDRGFKPTKYLMTEIFEPVKDPADTRFAETFFTEYYNSRWSDYTISQSLVDKYGKDQSLVGHVIKNTAWTYDPGNDYYFGQTYYRINASGNVNMVDEDGNGYLDGISVFTPNYTIPAEEKALLPFLCVDPSDMYDASGKWVSAETSTLGTYYKECYPSMRKFSSLYWIYNNQKWEGDVPILRLGEVYLIAAEAALRYNNDQAAAAQYVNAIRQRASVTGRAGEMAVAQGEVDLDFVLAERARELAGEQTRWYDLKRYGKLTTAYLSETNPDITTFEPSKHIVRPIPQSFLDAIANPDEFGTNGY
ncbi:RagB/SusD family nutrient uptake outer membrane protein [Gaoshiqia sediminis]|uniref:RagB/SusD family nutrient uptake outer membrane protein n=1 Tax=Gaoshiqia sediminis TaxID=2986998 RepID=A0AA42C7I5_9BACT|nr:RagB/SusD family nutrient uptake outer membrane protein [Gaoshiqia sediminis]MCW0481621.1 RagB/SusD family nutrient uptake outer membrane protein [Gaoshiqia sediminis]